MAAFAKSDKCIRRVKGKFRRTGVSGSEPRLSREGKSPGESRGCGD